ncbi:MAG: cytochrome c biogenesis protein CcdA [Candidatus Thermoplasmatota archaeon]
MSFLVVSVIVAFVAGIVALAMPCCFSVLLPSYFASAFRKRTAVLSMTLVFAGGIAAVILPVTLLANAVGGFLRERHSVLFVAGGFFMVLLGLVSLWGKSIMPQLRLPIDLKRTNAAGVFTMGVFSGVATSCCAPVLAGIIVLSALSTSVLATMLIGVAYVAGMVVPLLAAALLWDRSATRKDSILSGKLLRFRLAGKPVEIHSSNLIAGIMFTLMGAFTIVLGLTDTMIPTPGLVEVGLFQLRLEKAAEAWSASLAGQILAWAIVIVGVALLAVLLRRGLARTPRATNTSAIDPVCKMRVDPASARWSSTRREATYHFCSAGCKDAFDEAPVSFVPE